MLLVIVGTVVRHGGEGCGRHGAATDDCLRDEYTVVAERKTRARWNQGRYREAGLASLT